MEAVMRMGVSEEGERSSEESEEGERSSEESEEGDGVSMKGALRTWSRVLG